jgi:hypothetical protein
VIETKQTGLRRPAEAYTAKVIFHHMISIVSVCSPGLRALVPGKPWQANTANTTDVEITKIFGIF